MITEDYVSFETAKLLKEKGFNEKCNAYFYHGHLRKNAPLLDNAQLDGNDFAGHPYEAYSAPTLQMAMKWLREVHNLFIFISTWLRHKDGTVQYYYEIRNLNDKDFETLYDYTSKELDSYEKTCEAATKYCLENLI